MCSQPDCDTPPFSYSLRPATGADFAFIHAARVSGLRQYVAQIWVWDDEDQRYRFQRQFDQRRYQIIVIDGRNVGAIAVDWMDDAAFLADIEVVPEWRGLGLGTLVLRDLLAEAARRGMPVRLRVLRGNPARRLYERLGFQVSGETATHVLMQTWPDGQAVSVDAHSGRC